MSQASSLDSVPFGITTCGLGLPKCGVRRSFSRVAVGWKSACLILLYLATVAKSGSAQTERLPPNLNTILAGMAQARAENRTHLRPYMVTRNYKLLGQDRVETKAQVVADVSFVPPNFKQYAIKQASGSGLGERIVRRMLASEATATKDYRSTDFSPDNYDFRFIREETLDGQPCYVLELIPRRKVENLLGGNIWVDAVNYRIHRVDGEPAKNLSWWLRDVRIVLLYSGVEGMWLQTASESTAKVRILGQQTMESRDVNYRFDEFVAAGSSSPTRLPNHPLDQSLHSRVIQVRQSSLLVGTKKWIWNVEGPFILQ